MAALLTLLRKANRREGAAGKDGRDGEGERKKWAAEVAKRDGEKEGII